MSGNSVTDSDLTALEEQVSRWKSYPEYWSLDLDWMPQVPKHWQLRRLKSISIEPLKYGANESGEVFDTAQPRYIRITDINSDGSLRDDTALSLPYEIAEPYILKHGDLLFARSGATVGKSFIYKREWGKACYAGYLIRARLNLNDAYPEYVYYFVNSLHYWAWASSIFIQATIQNISAEKFSNLPIPLPSLEEQQEIISFLDHHTAEIDALITKKQELIERLNEQRTAIISHAVTKGLNPDVPMKDSGVDWLEEIPAHWEVWQLKYLSSGGLKNGVFKKSESFGSGTKLGCVDISSKPNQGTGEL